MKNNIMKLKKYSAYVKFKNGKNYMQFSNSLLKMQKLINIDNVKEVVIYLENNVVQKLINK
jgi:hypothetical protein